MIGSGRGPGGRGKLSLEEEILRFQRRIADATTKTSSAGVETLRNMG